MRPSDVLGNLSNDFDLLAVDKPWLEEAVLTLTEFVELFSCQVDTGD